MQYITTTELRTKSSELIESLSKGRQISLIHRSKVVAQIRPVTENQAPPIDVKKFLAFIRSVKPTKRLSDEEREATYRKHLEEKYGKRVS
ncbi:MAG TPA: hypothetical protein VLG67_04405 [Candidatus Saccharimonadales bacterium]|nr:hypothetical protein [Candidatus Saccharimonadales bacterium]